MLNFETSSRPGAFIFRVLSHLFLCNGPPQHTPLQGKSICSCEHLTFASFL